MLYIEEKISKYLPLSGVEFKSGSGRYFLNFRCHICGDSKESKSKKRGWLQRYKGHLVYVCYNCNAFIPFNKFLKDYFPEYHKDYLRELLTNNSLSITSTQQSIIFEKQEDLFVGKTTDLDLQLVIDLPKTHFAYQYIIKRKIPAKFWNDIYYSDNFSNWAHNKQPENFKGEFSHDERIIFPLRDEDGNIFGCSARSLFNIKPKYLTLKFEEDKEKIFGLDRINKNENVYVLEGPIDSLFINNSVAMVGATGGLEKLFNYFDKDKLIIIADNERRNVNTIRYIQKAINLGLKVVIWPNTFKYKDINDAIENGTTNIMEIIKSNTYEGLMANIKLNLYKNC